MKNHKILFILAFLAIGLWSCEEEEFDFLHNAEAVSAGARVKFIHAIPGGPAVDVLWQGKRLNGGRVTVANAAFLPVTYSNFFPALANEYAVVTAGTGKLDVEIPDNPLAKPATTRTSVVSSDATMENNQTYTYVVYGTAAAPKSLFFSDDLPPRTSNLTFVRILHVLSGAPNLDCGILGEGALVSDIAVNARSNWVSFPISEASGVSRKKLTIRLNSTKAVTLTTADIDFQVGRCVTIVIRGTQGGTGAAVPALSTIINRY